MSNPYARPRLRRHAVARPRFRPVLTLAVAFAVSAVLTPAITAHAVPGALDPQFSGDGKQTTDLGALDMGADVAVQPDGRIVVAGRSGKQLALVRYLPNGALDTSFSGDGTQKTSIGAESGAIDVVVQGDGKVVVAGFSRGFGGRKFALARYTADGVLDRTFSGDGKLTMGFGSGPCYANALRVRADGKILVAGVTNASSDGPPRVATNFALARLNPNGSLDRTFSGDGKQTTDFGGADTAEGIALQSDGKVVLAGETVPSFGTSDFAVARYNPDGSLDTTFSGDGKESTEVGSYAGASALALQSDGKIVLAGRVQPVGVVSYDFALVRYNSDGSLDRTFSADGRATTSLDGGDMATDVALQSDGKIVAVGLSSAASRNGLYHFGVARYTTDGSLDATFGQGGTLTTGFGTDGLAFGVGMQGTTGILVVGAAYNGSNYDFAIARYAVA